MWIKICLKFLIKKKIVKIRQAMEVPPPDPNRPSAARGILLPDPSPVRSYPHLLYFLMKVLKKKI